MKVAKFQVVKKERRVTLPIMSLASQSGKPIAADPPALPVTGPPRCGLQTQN